ncbi:MAG: DivIVA domain-containing protein [Deltaproteobacteria bacterium]|nr:DivIVA domain-containing protein [Deltaproteobacteria bacterium]
MKITPLDIQQQQFRVRFRGFDMVEVDNFLDLLANEFEELVKENNLLKEEDRRKAAKINELQSGEKDLREALIAAQRITDEMKKNAQKEGELVIEAAKVQGQKIVESARSQALQIEAEINQLKYQRDQLEAALRSTLEMYWRMLENSRAPAEGSAPQAE